MHETIAKIFAESEKPQHASCDDCHAIAGQMLDLIARLQQQSIEYRRLLWAWKTSPDAELKDKYEHFKQTLDANDSALADGSRAAERIVDVWEQWDRYVAESKTTLEKLDADVAAAAAPVKPNA